jgi:RluA family pseudouridine synthase
VKGQGQRGWKLDLGDHRAELTNFEGQLAKKKIAGKAAAKRGGSGKPRREGPVWKPGAGARRVGIEAGTRLAAYVARIQHGISVREAKSLIESGVVRIDGKVETFASRQIRQGEVVEVFAELAPQEHVFDRKRIIYDCPGFMAYDKPAWLAVTPTDQGKSWALIHILKAALGPELIPVHRIDADTSGVVLFAKQEKVARRLEEAFRDHEVHKTYLAIVRGHPRPSGEHRSYLVQTGKGQGFEHWESGHGADARAAVTTWEVIEQLGAFGALVKVQPKTGRHHQIRIHFSEMGHPLYGDRRHGDRRDPVQAPRHMLHAWKMELPNPEGGEAIRITAPKPREFEALADELRRFKGK